MRNINRNLVMLSALAILPNRGLAADQEIHLSALQNLPVEAPGCPVIALGAAGEVFVVVGPRFTRSLDHGETFEDVQVIGNDIGGSVVADAIGNVYAYWVNRFTPTTIRLTASQDGGRTWHDSPLQVNETSDFNAFFPRVAVDEGRRFYITWSECNDLTAENRAWFRRSLDGGATLEEPVPMWFEETFSDFATPRGIVTDGEGTVHVLISGGSIENLPQSQLFLQTSLDFGETWSGPRPVDDPQIAIRSGGESLACGQDGLVYVAWADHRNGGPGNDLFFSRSTDFGGTFEDPVRINTDRPVADGSIPEVRMRSDATGNVYMMWQDQADIRFNVSHDRGTTWSGDRSLFPTHFWQTARIAANRSGQVAVMWQSRVDGEFGMELNVSRDAGETWLQAPLRLDEPGGRSANCGLAVDGAGIVFTGWLEDFDDTKCDLVQFRRAAPTLGISLVPRDDGDGLLVIPPGGERVRIDIELRNYHPTDPLGDLTASLLAGLPDGRIIGPLMDPVLFGIPSGGARRGTLRARFPGNKPPGLYFLIVTTEGAIEDSVRMPIIKR